MADQPAPEACTNYGHTRRHYSTNLVADLTDVQRQRDILAAGWTALKQLNEHSHHCAGPVGDPNYCKRCSRFAVAVIRGRTPAKVVHLRCAEARRWQKAVDAADHVATQLNDVKETGR